LKSGLDTEGNDEDRDTMISNQIDENNDENQESIILNENQDHDDNDEHDSDEGSNEH
jgi:hypothetical protein